MLHHQHTEWYKEWFDSEYYHILYKHRDGKEAEVFIDNLIRFLSPPQNAKVLDMPCGKGRHAIYLNKKGFDVTGIDLSAQSMKCAKEHENKRLAFFVHDMRNPFKKNHFDIALNLYTSFGYFDDEADNYKIISTASEALKPGGILVIDFMNSEKVLKTLVRSEIKNTDGVEFRISRSVENNFVVKNISICENEKRCSFLEKVQLLRLNDFKKYLESSGMTIKHLFGDHSLNAFDEKNSERLIILSEKNK